MDEERNFPPAYQLETAVLFLIFNRLDTTMQVFESIRKAKPSCLFIASDGPRNDHPGETELVDAVRDYVMSSINWDCKVYTLFREENLGCKNAISTAIDWFFTHVEEGIILEDDCLPDQSFFPFCQELLQKYRDDERIMMISGTNYLYKKCEIETSYYFTRFYAIWGWATWKRAWALYDPAMSDWQKFNSQRYLDQIYDNMKIRKYLKNEFNLGFNNQINSWGIPWTYSCVFNYGLSICPKFNLISNIGISGTHAKTITRAHLMPKKPIDASHIIHPDRVIPNYSLDDFLFNKYIYNKPFLIKIIGYIIRLPKKLNKIQI